MNQVKDGKVLKLNKDEIFLFAVSIKEESLRT